MAEDQFKEITTPVDDNQSKEGLINGLEELQRQVGDSYLPEEEIMEELRDSEESFSIFVENLPIGIYFTDLLGKFLYGNKKAEDISGYTREEIIGKNMFSLDLIDAEKLKQAAKLLSMNIFGKPTGPDEFILKRKDGNFRNVLVSTQLMKMRGKGVVMGLVQDVTEQKKIEERYNLATEAATVGVWDWNLSTNEFYLDRNVKAILGYSDEEIPNDIEIWATYIHPDDNARTMDLAEACIEGRVPEYICEHRMLHKDGSVRWMLTRGRVIRNRKGKAVRMLGTDMDITDKKMVELEQENLIGQLHSALGQVKRLSGLLPICASCKKVRDDNGYWHQVEEYIQEHSEVDFSHGICPECAQKHYPQYEIETGGS